MDKPPPNKNRKPKEMHTQSDRKHTLRHKKEDESENKRIKIGPRGSPRTRNLQRMGDNILRLKIFK